ncbi:MAG: DUF2752 domain-containing protein [Flavobacteriaceae bacterium]
MTMQEQYMLPCLNKKLFGIECLGCGMQRSFILVFQGDFVGAFKMYPAIFTIIILVLFIIFNLFKKFKYDYKIKMGLLYLNIVIIVVSYLIKITN